jgi:hypothetical protein
MSCPKNQGIAGMGTYTSYIQLLYGHLEYLLASLVGGFHPSEKYAKKNHVPNHQPATL